MKLKVDTTYNLRQMLRDRQY